MKKYKIEVNINELLSLGYLSIDNCIFRKQMNHILDVLLLDRTLSTNRVKVNIKWACDNYVDFGNGAYAPSAEMKPELVSGKMSKIIVPRSMKNKDIQKDRTKKMLKFLPQFG